MVLPSTIAGQSWLATAASLAAVYLVSWLVHWAWHARRPRGYPPGPPTTPLLGNMLDIPPTKQYLKYSELAQQYGEIVGLKIATQNIVVLNSAHIVHELLEKRHDIYSGRAYSGILQHVMRDGPHITVSEGEYLRRWRTAARILLRPAALRDIRPKHAAAAAYCVETILQAAAADTDTEDQSDAIFGALENWALTGPLNAVCGVGGVERDPAWKAWYYAFSKENLAIMEPTSIPPLDLFPLLHYVPGWLAPWKAIARRVNDSREAICDFTLDHAHQAVAKRAAATACGHDLPVHEGLMARVLRAQEEDGDGDGGADKSSSSSSSSSSKTPFSDEELAKIGGGLLEASIATTLASFRAWLKVLAAHPRVVAKIQDELDAVCGTCCPPQESHIDSLPYLKATLNETWRWRVPTPVSLPHRLIRDDTYNGYVLPKDTVLIQNTYLILRDPAFFDAPDDFVPERYMAHPAGLKPDVVPGPYNRSISFVFGAGRRACPGDAFSAQSMTILMAKLLWACDLVPTQPVDVSPAGFFGETLIDPLPWKMRMVPRSAERKAAAVADREALEPLLA